MIIQLPRDTTSIVLRFDRAHSDGSDPYQTITLISGDKPAPAAVAATPRGLILPTLGARRRTKIACVAVGMLVAGLGVSILQSPRAEPAMFQPRPTVWNDGPPETRDFMPQSAPPEMREPIPQSVPPQMPERMRAELDHGPTVVPPDAGPPPLPESGHPAGAPPSNPFGLE